MASIFESADLIANHVLNFWSTADDLSLQDLDEMKVFSSNLLFLMPNGSWKERKVALTTTCLYYMSKHNDQPKRMAVIMCKKLEILHEEENESERFGFMLSQGGVHEEFYAKTKEDLNLWIEKLNRQVILISLENDYKIIKEIGSGNYAKVYLAQDIKENKEYAIKSIDKDLIINSSLKISLIIDEITVMRKLNHPFLLTLHRVYESDKHIHLVLDYVTGGDLYQRVTERKVYTEEKAAIFMKNLFDVMDYMHSMNVIHRDLKPENILLVNNTSDVDFKIADFGFACEGSEDQNLRCGSPGYIAPEILKKKKYGPKVDIFSAGVILYVMLSSRVPFCGKTRDKILHSNLECKIYFQDKYWKHISKEGIDLVLRLTDCNPDNRITAKQALEHPWVNMMHKPMPVPEILIPEVDNVSDTNDVGISSVLMKRMNDKRGVPDIPGKSRREEEEKLSVLQRNMMNKKSKNLLLRLREADTALN